MTDTIQTPINGQTQTPSNPNHSKIFKWLVFTLAELILLIGAFALGTSVGFHKAGFSYSWATHYRGNFGGPTTGQFMPPPSGSNFFTPHGEYGEILSVNGTSSIIIKDSGGNENTILISPGATIRQDYQTLLPQNLKAGQDIVVIGQPNDQGQIEARFIRVLDQN